MDHGLWHELWLYFIEKLQKRLHVMFGYYRFERWKAESDVLMHVHHVLL